MLTELPDNAKPMTKQQAIEKLANSSDIMEVFKVYKFFIKRLLSEDRQNDTARAINTNYLFGAIKQMLEHNDWDILTRTISIEDNKVLRRILSKYFRIGNNVN